MKTINMFKKAALLCMLSLALVSCGGNKNTSGGNSPIDPFQAGGVIPGQNGQALPGNWLDIVRQENPCRTAAYGGQPGQPAGYSRTAPINFPVNVNANVGAMYVGVTSEGDIAYIKNLNGQIMLSVEVCQRPDLGSGGQVSQNIVINNSIYCPMGEITAATLYLQGNNGMYGLGLRPIHVPGAKDQYGRPLNIYSSLCGQQQGGNPPYYN